MVSGGIGASAFGAEPVGAVSAVASGGRVFNVRAFGAVGDGKTFDTDAINAAIDACTESGGGIVYVAPGTYLCKSIVLKSNVTLYLDTGALIQSSSGAEDFATSPHRHLIYAREAQNITITGGGRIDGAGEAFWTKVEDRQPREEWADVATYDYKGVKGRANTMLDFFRVTNLRIEKVHLTNAAAWSLKPMECTNVVIDGITLTTPVYGPNTDGIDATGCTNLVISNCVIHCGDDALCFKSEGRRGDPPAISRNILITNCVVSTACNGFKFGTNTYGGFENVVLSNCTFYAPPESRLNQRPISAIALEMVDGGWVDGVTISNIQITNARCPIFIRRGNRRPPADEAKNYLRNVVIDGVQATGGITPSSITGLPDKPVENVTLSDVVLESVEDGEAAWADREIPEQEKSYPEARMFGRLPGYGLYARHVRGLRLRNLELRCGPKEQRPAIVMDDVIDADLGELRAKMGETDRPVVQLKNSRGVTITNAKAPKSSVFLKAEAGTADVTVLSSDLRAAAKPIDAEEGVVAVAGSLPAEPS